MKDFPDIETRAVPDERGFVLVFDLWVAGKWVGSRRTVQQCEDWLSFYIGTPVHAASGTPW